VPTMYTLFARKELKRRDELEPAGNQ
jgi:hypothetical protein